VKKKWAIAPKTERIKFYHLGTFQKYSRDGLKELIEKTEEKMSGSISKKTDYCWQVKIWTK
jgi:NAD-dependent DNA ligase